MLFPASPQTLVITDMATLGMFLAFQQFSSDTQQGKYCLKRVGLSAHAAKKQDASIIAVVPPLSLNFFVHKSHGTTRGCILVNTVTTTGDGVVQLSPNFPSALDVPESARGACAGGIVDGATAPLATYQQSIQVTINLIRQMRLDHQVPKASTPTMNLAVWNAAVQHVTAATTAILAAAKAIDEANARVLVQHARQQAARRTAARAEAQRVLQHAQLLQAQEELRMRQLLALQQVGKKRRLLVEDCLGGMFGEASGPTVGRSASASAVGGIQDALPPAVTPAPTIAGVDLPNEQAAIKWLQQRRARIQHCQQMLDEENRTKDWQAELRKAQGQEQDVLRVLENFQKSRVADE